MPFRSRRQQKWMFANKPKMAKRWAKETPNIKSLPKRVKKKKITMSKSSLIKEHRELIKTLKNPTKAKLNKEKKDQSKELREFLKKKGYKRK